MLTQTLAASILASLAIAAPLSQRDYNSYTPSDTYNSYNSYNTQYDSGFPLCAGKVDKPSYDNKGRAYGYENGKSCILPASYSKYTSNYGYSDNTKYDAGYPVCQKSVEKPAYDDKGRAYGYEDGKSCILPKGYKSYNDYTPKYDYAPKNDYAPKYDTPKTDYAPKYDTPKTDYAPKYDYNTKYDPAPKSDYSPKKSYAAYQEQPNPKPDYNSYQKPSSNPYSSSSSSYSYGALTDCDSASAYFQHTGSPTLIQCVSIACAPGQTWEYKARALYQCAQLEEQARGNNGGYLPQGW